MQTLLNVRALVMSPAEITRMRLVVMFFIVGMLAVLVSKASAQGGYDSIPMHEQLKSDEAALKVEKMSRLYLLTGNGSKGPVIGYYQYYVPAKMTELPDGVKHVSKLCKETLAYLSRIQRSNRPEVTKQLLLSVFKGMKQVAEGNHHPAARINAILVLARLDTAPANNATRTPPTPLSNVLPILLAIYGDEDNVDGVRAAALQGIRRHVLYSFPRMSGQDKTTIATAMTQLLESETPQGRPPNAHAYLQRFAIDILEMLGPANDAALGDKLVSISTDPNRPSLIALYSASRIGPMGKTMANKIADPERVLGSWTKRVHQAFQEEAERLGNLKRPEATRVQPKPAKDMLRQNTTKSKAGPQSGMQGEDSMSEAGMESMDSDSMSDQMVGEEGMGYGGMRSLGRGAAKAQPPQVLASRRKLNHVLQQLHLGVTGAAHSGMPSRGTGGLLASVGDGKKEVIEDWVIKMEEVLLAINDDQLDSVKTFQAALGEQVVALEEFIGVEEEASVDAPDAAKDADSPDELAPISIDELAAPTS